MTLDQWLSQLTDAERHVVEIAAQGGSLLHIANHRCVVKKTVAFQLNSIFRKLQVRDRHELIAAYWQHKLRDAERAWAA